MILTWALPVLACVGQGDPSETSRAELERHLRAGEEAAVIDWFKAHPDAGLPFFDHYLEGGLKLIERGSDRASADASFEMGLKFAALADRALGEMSFSEYARAFAGWDAAQQKQFRAGQRLFREGMQALKTDAARALGLCQQSLDQSKPLGDYWGTAMAQSGIGAARLAQKEYEPAKAAFTEAARLYERLHLRQDRAETFIELAKAQIGLGDESGARDTLQAAQRLLTTGDPPALRENIDKLLNGLPRASSATQPAPAAPKP